MNDDFYTYIGYAVVKCMKYIFIPFGVAFSARILTEKILHHSLKGKEKNGHIRTVLIKNPINQI